MTPEERLAVVESQVSDMRADVARMSDKIDRLTEAANKGRGAVAVLVSAGTIGGSIIGWLASHFNFH